eukprot:356187-Chlamydomonas_euryale.AAC.3
MGYSLGGALQAVAAVVATAVARPARWLSMDAISCLSGVTVRCSAGRHASPALVLRWLAWQGHVGHTSAAPTGLTRTRGSSHLCPRPRWPPILTASRPTG